MERLIRVFQVTSSATAVGLLLAVNLLPLVGVLLWGWNVYSLLVLYWVENGIVGLLAVARIVRAEGPLEVSGVRLKLTAAAGATKALIVPFFLVHYGLFWAVHGVFVFTLPFFLGLASGFDQPGGGFPVLGPDGFPVHGAPGLPEFPVESVGSAVRWDAVAVGAAALAVSHGASFVLNYLGRREYLATSAPAEAMAPYGRVVVLHVTIILGAVASLMLGTPLGAVVVLVLLKTAIDLWLHVTSHRKAGARQRLFAAA